MKRDIGGPGDVTAELVLNRLLFERQTDAFIFALADYIIDRGLVVSPQAIDRLTAAVSDSSRERRVVSN